MKKMLFLAILFVIVSCCFCNVYAGAWAQPKGKFYTKATFIFSDANGVLGTTSPATFRDYAIYFYGEYGFLPRLTGIISTPFFKKSQNEANFVRGKTTGYFAGDIELQAKYQFLDKPVVASALVGIKQPAFYDIADIPPLGNNETDFDVKLLLGASLYPVPAYLTGDVGYRIRGGDFVDEFHFNFEAGYTLKNLLLLRFVGSVIRNNGESDSVSNLFGFPLTQQRTRLGGGFIVLLNQHIDVDVTYLKTTAGLNIPDSKEVFVGIAFKR